jgi:DNA-3-methyladenine glycosylase II
VIAAAQGGVVLPAREPFDWPRLLDWLGARAIPGLEAVADGIYTRGGVAVARVDGGIEVSGEADPAVVARVFDVGHDPAALGDDPLFERAPGIRVPGAWSGWELAVRAVLGQQVSVAGARRTAQKLVAELGEAGRFPPPEVVASGPLPGMPAARARALRALAEAVAGGLALDPPLDVAATRAALLALPGFGPWTVEYIAMRALRDPDAWPGSDLWLKRAAAGSDPERWRPWRAYAAMVLWQTS